MLVRKSARSDPCNRVTRRPPVASEQTRGPQHRVGPRSVRAVADVDSTRTCSSGQSIGQILVQPVGGIFRMCPMHPAIQAIPTFGI